MPFFVPQIPILVPLSWTRLTAVGTNTTSLTIPADYQVGDICILYNVAKNNTASTPTTVIPTDFLVLDNATAIQILSTDSCRGIISWKQLVSGDPNTALTLMNSNDTRRGILQGFRPSRPVKAVPYEWHQRIDAANFSGEPVNTVVSSGERGPVIIVGAAASDGTIDPFTWSPTEDSSNSASTTRAGIKAYNTSPANVGIDIADEGAYNGLTTGGFRISTNNTWKEDFSGYDTGSVLPYNWTHRSNSATGGIQAEAISGSVSGQELKITIASDGDRYVSFDPAGNTNNADVEVLASLYMVASDPADNTSHAGVFVRRTGANSAENAYYASFRTDGSFNRTIFSIRKHVAGSSSNVSADTGVTWDINTRYWVRLRAIGTSLKAKFWEDGSAEPSSWNVDTTDSDVTGSGYVGLFAYDQNGDPAFDYFSVAVGGGTAPGP